MYRELAQKLKLPGGQSITGNLAIPGTSGTPTIGSIISAALPFVIGFAGLGLLVMLILGGFTLLTSAGDAKKLEQGKQQLTFGIVGFLIVVAAYFLVQMVGIMFGLTSITDVFK